MEKMTKEEIRELYRAITGIYGGDYCPEDETVPYDADTYSTGEEYENAILDFFVDNPDEWESYVDGAKDFYPEFFINDDDEPMSLSEFEEERPDEVEVLKKYDFFSDII